METLAYFPIGAYLAIQGMVFILSIEICFRYVRWYIHARRAKLPLAPLMLSIAVIFFGATFSEGFWIYVRFTTPLALVAYVEHVGPAMYLKLDFIRSLIVMGMIGLLIPLWRIWDGFSWWRITFEILFRIAAISILYLYGLYFENVLNCYLHGTCLVK